MSDVRYDMVEPVDCVSRRRSKGRVRRRGRSAWWFAFAAVPPLANVGLYTSSHRYAMAALYAAVCACWIGQFVIARRKSRRLADAEVAWAAGERAIGVPARIRARYTRLSSLDHLIAARSFGQRAVQAGTAGVLTLDDESLTWAPRGIWSPVGTPFTIDRHRVTGCHVDGHDVVVRLGRTGLLVLDTPAGPMVAAWAAGRRRVDQSTSRS